MKAHAAAKGTVDLYLYSLWDSPYQPLQPVPDGSGNPQSQSILVRLQGEDAGHGALWRGRAGGPAPGGRRDHGWYDQRLVSRLHRADQNQQGEVLVQEGARMSDDDLLKMNWYVEGVTA